MIHFKSIQNFRDLGGIPAANGRKVRSGLLYRCGLLGKASDEDLRFLSENLTISKVIDFRSTYEMEMTPDRPVPGAEYIPQSIFPLNAGVFKGFAADPIGFVRSDAAKMLTDGFYVSFVSDQDCQQQYAQFLRELINAEGRPFLFHCTQGKDRTGLGAAFILYALGADRKTVLEDFNRSNAAFAAEMAEVSRITLEQGGDEDDIRVVMTLFGASKSQFIEGLDWIDAHFGSMDAYLKGPLGLSEEDILLLRERYLEEA